LKSENLSPWAVEITTTRSPLLTTPRAASFSSAASATPVCGQVNRPARSARAAASASSCSLACSTMPSSASSARRARPAETGAPIWMAEASVFLAVRAGTTTPGAAFTPAAVVAW
jgi:hypothetical protein